MKDRRRSIPLVVRIAAWLMLLFTLVAVVPDVFTVMTAKQGEMLPMLWSVETRVDGFSSKLPHLILPLLWGLAGVMLAAFILRGNFVGYGISLVFMSWASVEELKMIEHNGWPDTSGFVVLLITALLLGGLPGYLRADLDARAKNRGNP